MVKVYLVRHGETDFNKGKKDWGQKDETKLNSWGKKQAKKLANSLKNNSFNKIFVSELIRAKQTAKEIQKKLNVPIISDKLLN